MIKLIVAVFVMIVVFVLFQWAIITIKSERLYDKYMDACIVENKDIPNPDIFCRSLWKENNR